VRTWFRVVAFAEACSWLGLLIGMFIHYILDGSRTGIEIFGPIHGGIFVAYCLITLLAWRVFDWSFRTAALALIASIPPFATALFEVIADRRGLLGGSATTPEATKPVNT